MKILIATGIYPPATSGPAQYAFNMEQQWRALGHSVRVHTYTFEHRLPVGIRHIWYFCKILPSVMWSDIVFGLDTFSVGLPAAFATWLLRKKMVIRTGGDFLWEGYVERTGDLVKLSEFYTKTQSHWNTKEKIIFACMRRTLQHQTRLIFSTAWQRDIFLSPYGLDMDRTLIIENCYGTRTEALDPNDIDVQIQSASKAFIAGVRPLKWKNISRMQEVFALPEITSTGAVLDATNLPYKEFMKKMTASYAVILCSLGDISPHMILDAIRLGKPFIVTEENGLMNRIAPIAVTVNPLDSSDIARKVAWLLQPENYRAQAAKVRAFNHSHTWNEIAQEILTLFSKI